MFHATDSNAATAIVQSQRFRRSTRGLLGPGVYLSKDRGKAEAYRNPVGTGPMLKCRVKLGVCIELHDRNGRPDPLMTTWHSHCSPCRGCSLPGGRCEVTGPRYNSAWAPAGQCRAAHCKLEENCVYNPERIDHIEIVDGPGMGMGQEFWPPQPLKRQTSADRISQIGRATGFVWVWKDDWEWRPYTPQEAATIELAHQAGQAGDVNISPTHAVNLVRMVQMRHDDKSKTRQIERRVDSEWRAPASRYQPPHPPQPLVAQAMQRQKILRSKLCVRVGIVGVGMVALVSLLVLFSNVRIVFGYFVIWVVGTLCLWRQADKELASCAWAVVVLLYACKTVYTECGEAPGQEVHDWGNNWGVNGCECWADHSGPLCTVWRCDGDSQCPAGRFCVQGGSYNENEQEGDPCGRGCRSHSECQAGQGCHEDDAYERSCQPCSDLAYVYHGFFSNSFVCKTFDDECCSEDFDAHCYNSLDATSQRWLNDKLC